jgi:flagellar hook protein FlgE
MMPSLFTGVAGLQGHQTMMDVVGNNIANVDTVGYKSSEVTFQEALSQEMSAPSATTNPTQIGLGVQVGAISPVMTQGASETTGKTTDLAIQGNGFFAIQQGNQQLYTRDGSFSFDSAGNLVTANGDSVMGWQAAAGGAVNTNTAIQPLVVPIGQTQPATATTAVEMGGNLDASAAVGATVSQSVSVYDSLGNSHTLDVIYTNTGPNAWTAGATVDGNAVTLSPAALTFSSSGTLTSAGTIAVSGFTPPGASAMSFNIDLAGATPLVQYGGSSTIQIMNQNGSAVGNLQGVEIAGNGTITGQFSNGQSQVLGQIATANFSDPAGLVQVGNSNFASSSASGLAQVGTPGSGSLGTLQAGTLEMSNVDLAQEFTNMIIAERGFEANSKVITTSDQMLQDLVSMKQ